MTCRYTETSDIWLRGLNISAFSVVSPWKFAGSLSIFVVKVHPEKQQEKHFVNLYDPIPSVFFSPLKNTPYPML